MTRAMRVWFLCGCAVVSVVAAPAAWRAGATQWSSKVEASSGARPRAGAARAATRAGVEANAVLEPDAGHSLAGAARQGGARAR
ncbi:MAG: hypothetical protein RL112_2770 [Planctomycetota bacterium]|jgi:hypothetical protein